MALSSNLYAFKVQRLENIFSQTPAPNSVRMGKLWQLSQDHPKPAFSKKRAKGDQGKFLKNRQESSPRLKGLKALWRKWHYPLTGIRSKCKDWARFWRKTWLKECRNCQVIAIFAWSPKSRIFGKSLKGGPGEIFKKSPRK